MSLLLPGQWSSAATDGRNSLHVIPVKRVFELTAVRYAYRTFTV